MQIAKEEMGAEASFFAARELARVLAEEREWRCRLWSQGESLLLPVPAMSFPLGTESISAATASRPRHVQHVMQCFFTLKVGASL